jgi:hypothetical protein
MPSDDSDPTVLVHAYPSVPAPTYIVPIVIEPIHLGIYRCCTKPTIQRIIGGAGIFFSGHLKIGE